MTTHDEMKQLRSNINTFHMAVLALKRIDATKLENLPPQARGELALKLQTAIAQLEEAGMLAEGCWYVLEALDARATDEIPAVKGEAS